MGSIKVGCPLLSSPSSWNQSDQGLRQRRRLQQLDDRDGVGYIRGKVGWQRVGAGGWMGLHLPPHVSVVEPTLACRRPPTRAMPSRPGRVRGLVAEWLVGMAALLRFVRGCPERDGAAVVVCSSSASLGTFCASRSYTLADSDLLAARHRSLKTCFLSSASPSTTVPA